MYAFISGRVVSVSEGLIVLENNGIGYALAVSNNTLYAAGQVGTTRQLFTYLHVKEDVFALYGFATEEEKNMFLRLITISGVGPKLALQVLSGMDSKQLAMAIVTGDIKSLAKVKGLGKKTAERIILELRESIGDDQLGGGVTAGDIISADGNSVVNDAVFALQSLGIPKSDALKAVTKALEQTDKLEELITIALQNL